jgi:adenylylsulfate kinase-like enzyme
MGDGPYQQERRSNMDTPRTDEVHALINNCGGSVDAAFHDMLNHARQLERELIEAKDLLRIVLNGGIDDGLDWLQVMDKVRDILKPNDRH